MQSRFIGILLFLSFLSSCNDETESPVISTPIEEDFSEFKSFNLFDYQLNATIMLPDETASIGASTFPEVEHEYDGFKWELTVGPNFQMIIEDFGDNRKMVELHKKRIKELNVFEVNYMIDSPDLLVYELVLQVEGEKSAPKSVGQKHHSYHVFGQKIIDGFTYVFRSRDEGYEKKIIDLMAKSIRSVKENK